MTGTLLPKIANKYIKKSEGMLDRQYVSSGEIMQRSELPVVLSAVSV